MKTNFSKYGYEYVHDRPSDGQLHKYIWRFKGFDENNPETFFSLAETHHDEVIETEIFLLVGVHRMSWTIEPSEYKMIPDIHVKMNHALQILREPLQLKLLNS